jgi:transcriptional regulator with GAF, ATPase, and Fis domain
LLVLRRLTAERERVAQARAESRAALAAKFDLCGIVFESDACLVMKATHVAPADVLVLLTGLNGSGKKLRRSFKRTRRCATVRS